MDRLFPPDLVSLVFWAAPVGFDGPTSFRIRVEANGEVEYDEAFAVEFLDDKGRHLLGEVELVPGHHIITVDVTRDSTDITAGESRNIVCETPVDFSAGEALAMTVVPSHPLCWWPASPQWLQFNGDPVSPDYIHDTWDCEREDLAWLVIGDERIDADAYARETDLVTQLDDLPADAIDSGLRGAGRELWLTAEGDKVYIRTVSGIEELSLMERHLCA